MTSKLEQGATNCVVDCARVRKGNTMYIVNQENAVEENVSETVRKVAEAQGARTKIVWAKALPKGGKQVPEGVLEAFRMGDVVISHYPSLRREVLYSHVAGDNRSRATNRATTEDLLQSDWARFPYSLQLAIINTIDSMVTPGKKWRVTSPIGTDIQGVVGTGDSAVSQAYFVRGEDENRASKNFPGGVHTPVMSSGAEGVIYVDHANVPGGFPTAEPLRLELKEGRVVSIQGGDEAGQIRKELEKTDGFMDSWHAGTNPKTIVPCDRRIDPSSWWIYAHCSPMILHFHLGRSHAPVNVAVFNQTVYVEGRKIYEEGYLALSEEATIQKAIRYLGTDATWLSQTPIDLS